MSEKPVGLERSKDLKSKVRRVIGGVAAGAATAAALSGCYGHGPSSKELATDGMELSPDQLTTLQVETKKDALDAIRYVMANNPAEAATTVAVGDLEIIDGSSLKPGPDTVVISPKFVQTGSELELSISGEDSKNIAHQLFFTFSNPSDKFANRTLTIDDLEKFVNDPETNTSQVAFTIQVANIGGDYERSALQEYTIDPKTRKLKYRDSKLHNPGDAPRHADTAVPFIIENTSFIEG